LRQLKRSTPVDSTSDYVISERRQQQVEAPEEALLGGSCIMISLRCSAVGLRKRV